MAWRCWFLTARVAARRAPGALVDFRTGHRDILKYRDCTAVSKVDGSRSLIYNVPWTMMFTDDKVSYLEWCKAKTLELVKTGKVELPLPRPPP